MKKPKDPFNIFTNNDIEIIKKEIVAQVTNNKVVPRIFFYKSLGDKLDTTLDKDIFNHALSNLISEKQIYGFEIRRGRSGGIHREGLFDKHDARRHKKIKAREDKHSKETVTIKIDKQLYLVKKPFSEVFHFFTYVLDADTDPNGNVTLAKMKFSIVETHILKNYILNCCNGKKI